MNTKTQEVLESLKTVSVRMGNDKSLIQVSGGNTSLKENGILWIKASGKCLADALHEEIFLPLNRGEVSSKLETIHKPEVRWNRPSDSPLRPSIETTLHALMPHRVVLHSHSVDAIAHTLLPQGKRQVSKCLEGLDWQWIPYHRPGEPLTKAIAHSLEDHRPDILILANHGLVVGGETPEAAEHLQNEVVRRLKLERRSYQQPQLSLLQSIVSSIPGLKLPDESIIHSLATDPWSLSIAQRNPAYPDHVVFCGMRPCIVEASIHILITLKAIINQSQQEGEKEISYILIPKVGVILLKNASAATEAMLYAQAEIFIRIPENEEVCLLSDNQCAELTNWEAEKYRKALAKSAA